MIDKTKILVGDNRGVVAQQKNQCYEKAIEVSRDNNKPPIYTIAFKDDDIDMYGNTVFSMSQKDMKEFLYKVGKLVEID